MAKLFVISAPSGAGKTTLINRVRKTFPDLAYSISATTRSPRAGEVNGREYFFKSVEEFKSMIAQNELAEWQEIYGRYYGTPRAFLDNCLLRGQSVILDLDVYGKTKFDLVYPDAYGIFITVPSIQVLYKRLSERKTDAPEEIQKRVSVAEKEIAYAQTHGKYEFTLYNEDLEQATGELLQTIRTHKDE